MGMIGGDLAAMAALARRFDEAGSHFQAQSATLAHRLGEALDGYATEMRALEGDARALDDEIGAALVSLRAQADVTQWTGAHRDQQERALAALEADIVSVRTGIDGFLAESGAVVHGRLAADLAGLHDDVDRAGRQAELVASTFARHVDRQRAAFDMVMNG
jgi:hypothetical protein